MREEVQWWQEAGWRDLAMAKELIAYAEKGQVLFDTGCVAEARKRQQEGRRRS